ncbi:transporter [Pseudomonas sp. NPDC089752]|uniref:transporter n=1 Tax=Pseudomonas sp. NPDC089752 TaxID=3364472 RepID=UPI00380C2A1C
MNTFTLRYVKPIILGPAFLVFSMHSNFAHAIGADIGDWVAPMPGHDLLALYGVHTKNSKIYEDGHVTDKQAQLDVDFGLLRYTHPMYWGSWIANPQIAIPYVNYEPKGVNTLNKASGVGDVFIVLPFWPLADRASRHYFSVSPFLYIPTGEYKSDKALNPGENRWKAALQLGYQKGLGENFNVELIADATVFGSNQDYGPNRLKLTQKPLYDIRAAITYQFNDNRNTLMGFGVQQVFGGENKLDGVEADDRQKTTSVYAQASAFVTPKDQLLFSTTKDIETESGFKLDYQFKIRYLHVF